MKLGSADIKKLEELWVYHEELKGQLAYRRYELLYQPSDKNVGGGKSNLPGKPVEQEVIKLNKDNLYRNLTESIMAVEDVYRKATKEQKLIAQYRYWEKDLAIYEWPDIAHEITKQREDDKIISKDAALRMRNKMMRETAKKIGWVTKE
ncbi:transcriptional regulator [Staphylococcus debuckii]|uniref:transcriptional regulator n=1 Tax=Staphylococcus debuckii TaxID=2044912 RepID=UPI000F433184|nr:transcriptional regulator [Staphylococcus debuckii]AYU54671.1 transcriptional regulator [Staphylococcus debuckii]